MARNVATARSAASARKIIPYSLDFDGNNDYLDIDVVAGDLGTTSGSIEFWIYREFADDVAADQIPVSLGVDADNRLYLYYRAVGDVWRFQYEGNNVPVYCQAAASAIAQNTWTYVALTWDTADKVNLYISGVLTGTPQTATAFASALNAGALGTYYDHASNPCDAKMAEIRFWDEALNIADIKKHAQSFFDTSTDNTSGVTYVSNCKAHYKLTEGTGQIATDASGNNNNGTFKGAGEPAWSTTIPYPRGVASARNAVV